MKQTPFEKYGGTYTQQGDYLLPDIKLPEQHPKQSGGNHQCQANLCITIWQGGALGLSMIFAFYPTAVNDYKYYQCTALLRLKYD